MSLTKKVASGVKWVALANIFKQLLSLISVVIFARLLSTDDFGIFAILMIFTDFLAIFSNMGTSSALIHIKNPSNLLLSSTFYFNIFIGVFLYLSMVLLSGPISIFFDNPEIEGLLEIVSLNFIIVSFGIVQNALFEKNINFKNVSLIQSFSALVGVATGITAAYLGFGVFSLVIQTLVTSFLNVGAIWFYSTWRPEWCFSFNEIKKIWRYSANLSVFDIINYFSKNADNFLIGKYLSASALGVYSVAYKIMLYPLQNISRILMRVLFPAFSKLQNDNVRFQKAYLRVIFFISLVSFPIMTGLMASSEPLVNVLFGDKWDGLAILLVILAPSGMLRSIYTTVGSIYMAKGKTDIQLKLGTVNAILTVLGFIIGLQFGINGVAFSYLIVNLIMLYPTLYISWKQIGLSVKEGVKVLMPIFIISVLMGGSVFLSGIAIAGLINNQIIQLIVEVFIGLSLYLLLLRLRYGELSSLIKEFKK